MGGHVPGRRFGAWWLVAVCLSVTAHLTCKRSSKDPAPPPPPMLGAIEIQDVSAPAGGESPATRRYDTEALGAIVRDRLVKSGVVMVPQGQASPGGGSDGGVPPPTVRVRGRAAVEIVEVEAKGLLRAAVALNLSTRPAEAPGGLNEDLSAASEQPFEVGDKIDRQALGQRLLERTVGDLVGGYAARISLSKAAPEQLHAAIVSDGGALREEAIRIAGTRGLKGEVPALLPLLHNDDERVRDAALGALIALGEQRAVSELTRTRSMRDRHEMRKILEAIAILGGEEARDYLSFVAASHDDEEIRRLATEAKARLERRGAPAGKGEGAR
jgi:hypothetical protein